MKNKKILLIGILLFVALIIGASFLYNYLKERVETDPLYVEEQGNSDDTSEETEEQENNLAQDFTMADINGNEVKLSDFIGKPVVMNFWASWCGPCKSEMPDFEEAYKTYGDEIHFLMVNLTDGSQETVKSASTFISSEGYTFPVYYDTKMEGTIAYSVYSVPRTYFIDAEGNMIAWANGALNAETLQKGIEMIQ